MNTTTVTDTSRTGSSYVIRVGRFAYDTDATLCPTRETAYDDDDYCIDMTISTPTFPDIPYMEDLEALIRRLFPPWWDAIFKAIQEKHNRAFSILMKIPNQRYWDKMLSISQYGKDRVNRMRRLQRACC